MKGETSYYKILGVNENASNNELRKAFCKLSIELHPDTTSLEIDVAKSKFQEVLEAYEHLNNSNLRKIYDDKLKENSRIKNTGKNACCYEHLLPDQQDNRQKGGGASV